MIETASAAVPVPTPAQATTGRRLWCQLMARVSSYEHWFGEGMPSEWLLALEGIAARVHEAKRDAHAAARKQEQREASKQMELTL